ncbi:MAG: nucleotide pyrophosphohydrolase [Bacteroidia bacterium]|nr:nucleotide pyrophosphohydrolase [Bacteroidia bacterium]
MDNGKNKPVGDIEEITKALLAFRDERDWEQFHTSKDLALGLSIEAGELNELFLWKQGQEAENPNLDRLGEELADVISYAFLLASKHGLDVKEIVLNKIASNARKYPVEKAKGNATKYFDLK